MKLPVFVHTVQVNRENFFKKIRSIYRRKKQAIARAHYQAMVWDADHIPNPQMPPATDYGWEADEDHMVPVTTEDPPAPGTITQLIKCGCKKSRCASHCSCRLNNLNCSELCMCGADEEVCANVRKELLGIDENEDEDSAM